MSKTVFTKVDYDLDTLVTYISLGEIGLPDIQRPFVWKNSKVRDLFDSMYKGYPVGYFLFWQNSLTESKRVIGAEQKQKSARLVIVDGQQRLTSLYAVINNIEVLRESFEKEKIQIAFNPLEERFEVADAAIKRDKAYIPDISIVWDKDNSILEIIRDYLGDIQENRELSDTEKKEIETRILRLQKLLGFPFTVLELAADVDEEAVSDVFVRINSKGTPLNQADFILTLMSVFWDEGRAELEKFCREARKPSKGEGSPFNYFIEPYPDQLLRVGVGVAFKRARLQYVYSILRGKDLETEKFSDERRVEQFELLKDAQSRVLNLQYWHDFMNCIRQAGFRSGRMISSQNNLLFSYMLYLIGRTEYKVPEFSLRQVIARWFFMSSLTGRFTGAPESAMEFDLARLRDIKTADGFINMLSRTCEVALTGDFWAVSLPNDMATSSSRSPSLFAYHAALVLLDAKALFSKIKVSDLLDPSVKAIRSAVERHHLFPKGYLNSLGLTSVRDTNQIANYALVEWGDNVDISDKSPSQYLPDMKARFDQSELEQMYHMHALPLGWENLEYAEFLERRRELIANIIYEGYSTLKTLDLDEEFASNDLDLLVLANNGDSENVEFKATLFTNLHTGNKDPRFEFAALRTIAGFLNTGGGTLIVGVSDDGSPVGINTGEFENEDDMSLYMVNMVSERIGLQAMNNIHIHFEDYQSCRVMIVKCKKSPSPVYIQDNGNDRFFIRSGTVTTELPDSQVQEYCARRFSL
jgi:hypothetical protein